MIMLFEVQRKCEGQGAILADGMGLGKTLQAIVEALGTCYFQSYITCVCVCVFVCACECVRCGCECMCVFMHVGILWLSSFIWHVVGILMYACVCVGGGFGYVKFNVRHSHTSLVRTHVREER
jgi:hypothetical protein